MSAALAAAVAAVTSVTVTVLSLLLGDRQQQRKEERLQRQDLNARYLNPLRLHLVENHYRLSSTLERTGSTSGTAEEILVINDPAELSEKDAAWFNGRGCALVSSVYLTACLFAQLKKVREDFPYLRLSAADDTQLAALLLRVQRGFLIDHGVYYVTQPSIGESMWVRDEQRLLTYREFCERLQDPSWRVWSDRLIRFHIESAHRDKRERTQFLLTALAQLTEFLDRCVGGGHSIESRQQAEGTEPG
ncbi:hypothetical protein AB0K89_10840 [Streptomyces cinnamoneus]|uniref:hypothetical protein n=1 Tax=Streptomyces cinnamoneus TaxID=53446 RepID=UPI00342AD789